MTIAQVDKEVKNLIKDHSVYGLETLINATVRACIESRDLDEAYVINLMQHAFKRIKEVEA